MLEQLFFIIFAIILFGCIFFKMIKKNDTTYVVVLAIQALGIAIDFIALISTGKLNMFFKFLVYLMSIILPLLIIILEKRNKKSKSINKQNLSQQLLLTPSLPLLPLML